MKTLIILDKAGSIGMQYALVDGDLSKYNGLVLNNNTDATKECIDFLMKGMASNVITFTNDMSIYNGIKYKTALVMYYTEKPLVRFATKTTTTTSSEPVATLEFK
jgi:hypothetical protein